MNNTIGFSTGCLWRSNLAEEKKLDAIRATGADAIELGYLDFEELKLVSRGYFKPSLVRGFKFVSCHAPIFPYARNAESVLLLGFIARMQDMLERAFDAVVFHPDRSIDYSPFRELPYPYAFENMDSRWADFRTPRELEKIFELLPKARFVFDVNHAHTNGILEAVPEFLRRFGGRLTHVHLSGSTRGGHDPLYKTQQVDIIRAAGAANAPLIIESALTTGELALELKYISDVLAGRA